MTAPGSFVEGLEASSITSVFGRTGGDDVVEEEDGEDEEVEGGSDVLVEGDVVLDDGAEGARVRISATAAPTIITAAMAATVTLRLTPDLLKVYIDP